MSRFVRGACLSVVLLLAATSARAEPVTLQQLETIVGGLGYKHGTANNIVVVLGVGPRARTFTIMLGTVEKRALISTYFPFPPDKLAAAPVGKLLEYNGQYIGPYFATALGKSPAIALSAQIPSDAVSASTLRATMDEINATADKTEELWNADKWTAAAK